MMKNREKSAREKLSRLQCVCALMGLIVTAAAIAVLARSAFADHRPPDLTVLPQALRPVGAGWALEVKVVNNGDMTAAAVEIEGRRAGRNPALRSTTFRDTAKSGRPWSFPLMRNPRRKSASRAGATRDALLSG